MRLKISDIRIDGNTQSRVAISQETINEYAEAMKGGDVFPPVTVFKSAQGEYWLADGYHRLYAAKQSGASEIEADVKDGDIYSAMEYAAGANAKHGIRRTNADKRRAVLMLLECPKYRNASDRLIAEVARVGHPLIASAREQFESRSNGIYSNTQKIEQSSEGELAKARRELAEMKAALKAEREKPPVMKVEYKQADTPETLARLRKAEEESKAKDKRLYDLSHNWLGAEEKAKAELVKAKEAEEKLKAAEEKLRAAEAKLEANKKAGKDAEAARAEINQLCHDIERYSKKRDIEREKLSMVTRSVTVLGEIEKCLLQRRGDLELMVESDITASWSMFDPLVAEQVAKVCEDTASLIRKAINKSKKTEAFVDVEYDLA